jgi:hypothetical protein
MNSKFYAEDLAYIHRQLRFSRTQVERALRRAGFTVTFRLGYGRVRMGAGSPAPCCRS